MATIQEHISILDRAMEVFRRELEDDDQHIEDAVRSAIAWALMVRGERIEVD